MNNPFVTTARHQLASGPSDTPLHPSEAAAVAAICDRLERMLGPVDRAGMLEDFAIVQSHCPLNLDALLAASDRVFVEELSTIIDATDRASRGLQGVFRSRFACVDSRSHAF